MSKKVGITVFTPTFNRGTLLVQLYNSLKVQSYKNFEWIVYDDGSTDDTKKYINTFIDENIINIKYIKEKNAGKHVAINNGVELARGELFFIVDSDDYLTADALEKVTKVWNSIDLDKRGRFIGVGGKKHLINKPNKDFKFKSLYHDKDAIKFSLKEKNIQDKAEIYVTEKLRNYKFPEFQNENFITEAVIWYKMSADGYLIRWFNDVIYIAEYLSDGLSNNFYQKRVDNILGTCYSYNKLSSYKLPEKYKFRYKINYFRYGFNKFDFQYLRDNLENKKFMYISALLGKFLSYRDNYKFDK